MKNLSRESNVPLNGSSSNRIRCRVGDGFIVAFLGAEYINFEGLFKRKKMSIFNALYGCWEKVSDLVSKSFSSWIAKNS